ncbi:MAG: cupin [Sneathiella sp.]|jgi:predicted cupin superfamily sugar epimerase|uniref:cupin domain-containing protein n=1 Tax=Sneathiella sp. TaxID=1964365 RepID=UPI000C4ED514|nr:cupin domain-containing protein [Sneathiella sp.]MAL79397.1 cupin [Sneathiella sp.]
MPARYSAPDIIAALGMSPHPEGGHFVETFRDDLTQPGQTRSLSTAIYYLLQAGERSHWHRVDAVEIWHYHAGAPLSLAIAADDTAEGEENTLGPDILAGARPQIIVPRGSWQSACTLGDWTLVGCTVAPGFEFSGFEMAPEGWAPGR